MCVYKPLAFVVAAVPRLLSGKEDQAKLSLCSSWLLEVIIIIIFNLHGLFLQPLYMITCSVLCFNGTSQVLE